MRGVVTGVTREGLSTVVYGGPPSGWRLYRLDSHGKVTEVEAPRADPGPRPTAA
jgi:hypothetical protein